MPKHVKKVKGIDAHQHTGTDVFAAPPEQWLADMIAAGRIVVTGDEVTIHPPGTLVHLTDWIVLDEHGALYVMTDDLFTATYTKDNRQEGEA